MRTVGLVIVVGTFFAVPGCFRPLRNERHVADRVFEPRPATADRVILDYRLVDQPAGDPFAVDELWRVARCPLPHETVALLAENGLRVGVVSGLVPPEFVTRVTNERYLIDPRALATKAGDEKVIPVNGPLETATVRYATSWATPPETKVWTDLECGLRVSGTPDAAGSFRLTCVPVVQFGSKETWLRPTADRTQFVWDRQKTREAFRTLAWDLPVGPGEYLVVGPTGNPTGTLGEAFFFASEPARVRQRFLVIRGRAETAPAPATTAVAARAAK